MNDSLGRLAGDEVLNVVAGRLREAARETDLVARRSGDTFLLLLADLEREGDNVEVAVGPSRNGGAARSWMPSPCRSGRVAPSSTCPRPSGSACSRRTATSTGSLLRNAEAAMLESKKGGHAYVVSNRGALDSSAKLRFVTRLRKAVESQRWALHYQPILELATGRMHGVEALIRWIEPDGTMVPPGDFIPLAEELGLIEAIGDWVVRELVYQAQAWRELDIDLDDQLQPVTPSVLAAGPREGDPRADPEGGVDPSRSGGRDHRVLRDERPGQGPGDPRGSARRRSPHRDR